MHFDTREKMTTKAAAEFLNIAESTIHKYVREGILKPVYDDWQNDGTRLFYTDDIEKLSEELKRPPGITVQELAKRLKVSASQIKKHITTGHLYATKQLYKGKETYFINEDDITNFLEKTELKTKDKKKYSLLIDEQEYFLYQLLENKKTGVQARVVDIIKGKILTDKDEFLSLQDAILEGFAPTSIIMKGKYASNKGSVQFKFPKPISFGSIIYVILDWLYLYVTPSNMNMYILDDKLIVSIKPSTIPINTVDNQEEINFLTKHINEGSINIREDKIILRSNFDSIKFYLKKDEKQLLKQIASEHGLTLEQLCENMIREKLYQYHSLESNTEIKSN
ncbi:helix-turn-helix domain-containing protein [Bacillus cereus]|nr:helix-turn-helix domain-containing protein [Bacillus cereus]MBF8118810.1 helix-turn-helix domain-containing protein [Bacillus cereus]MCC3687003.1 helix-turn-helix domain-containing protein [Bacillus cereus]